ncbi:hypothetical protein MIND_01292200 [Mycena indigotica]|uniref:DUF6535 domain-containing protein n=1 Tax=Mycena indigotica TaxID=2126181 RepID=A0A8H6VUH0_9AGAR|nr:uncharacterized protein MIND_01292200 [Mycena indigotica]KAF7290523.1 hypothetical protein MIND_01292200 [Mycena indigotica]
MAKQQGLGPSIDTPGDEPCAQIWSVYISEAEKYDKALVDGWRNNMNGLLIFAGLFSAILSAFIVESYKLLDRTPEPLVQIALFSLQNPGTPFNISLLNDPPRLPGPPPTAAVICNALWFIALGLSLASALTATLVDQWARDFLNRTEMLPSPVKRARIFAYLYYGIQRFRMHAFVGVIPLLLHMSLLFFLGGLVAFLLLVSNLLAFVAATLLAIVVIIYGTMTVLPLIQFDCPYQTPLSTILWSARRYFFRMLEQHGISPSNHADSPHSHSMVDAMMSTATVRSDPREARDKRALAWTMKSLADDDELEPFVEGIPNAIWGSNFGRRRKYDNLIVGLLKDPQVQLGSRIEHLLASCESGLLETQVKLRRQVVCLKAIWCLGMVAEMGEQESDQNHPMGEKRRFWHRRSASIELVDVEQAPKHATEQQLWEKPRLPTIEQPLSYFQGLQCLPSSSVNVAHYLPSITALANWNDLCALNGYVEKIAQLLQPRPSFEMKSNYEECKATLVSMLSLHKSYVWRHVIPTGLDGEQNLEMLVKSPCPDDIADWIVQVGRIIQQMPLSWNKVQYRILHSFLRVTAEASQMPYEFELTCETIRPSVPNTFDSDMVGSVLTTFSDNVQKAIKNPRREVTHVDIVLSILLPWFDKNKELDIHVVQRVTDATIDYINHRKNDDAVERVLRDCDITRLWELVTDRLITGRAEWLAEVSKAMWKLAMLFPGPSSPDVRFHSRPRFNAATLSVIPVAPFAVSVIALLKTHILNAYEATYAPQDSEAKANLQELEKQLVLHEKVSVASAFKRAIYAVQDSLELMGAVHGVISPFPMKGLALEPMPVLPTFTIRTKDGYSEWRHATMEVVEQAIKLGGRLERRMDQARFAIAIEFMQRCAAAQTANDLPYEPVKTFANNIMRGVFVQDPPHVDNQRSFVEALRGLTISGKDEHSRLARVVLESSLFAGREENKLPWLDDFVSIKALQDLLRTHLQFFTKDALGIPRKIEDVLGWLELKLDVLERGVSESSVRKDTIGR